MRWRRIKRRLLWAAVLFGLALLLCAVSVLRVGVWARDTARRSTAPGRRQRTLAH